MVCLKFSVVSLGFVKPCEASCLNPDPNTICYLKTFLLDALVIKASRQSMCLSWEVSDVVVAFKLFSYRHLKSLTCAIPVWDAGGVQGGTYNGPT